MLELNKIVSDIKDKGLNNYLKFSLAEQVKNAVDIGFRHFEITSDIFQLMPSKITRQEQEKLLSYVKEYGVSYSIHFPIWGVDISSPNYLIRSTSIQAVIKIYEMFKFLEKYIEVYVLHPTGSFAYDTIHMMTDTKSQEFIVNLFSNFGIQSIQKLLEKTEIDVNKIAIENIQFPFEKTLEIIDRFKGTKLCIDTAHILGGFSNNFNGKLDLIDIGRKYIERAREIHLQDFNDGEGIDHGALGTYKFPAEFIKILHEKNFTGPIVFELSYKEAYQSIEFIKKNVPEIKLPNLKTNLILD